VPNSDEEEDEEDELESARVSRMGTKRKSKESMAEASSKPNARTKWSGKIEKE
jgi:hypothetical protein